MTINYQELGWQSARQQIRYNQFLFRAFWVMWFALLGAMLLILWRAAIAQSQPAKTGRADGVAVSPSFPPRLPSPPVPENITAGVCGREIDKKASPHDPPFLGSVETHNCRGASGVNPATPAVDIVALGARPKGQPTSAPGVQTGLGRVRVCLGTESPLKRTRSDIFSAIRQIESGGNDWAVGDNGASRGPVQCGRAAWKDACEYGKSDLDYDEYVWNYAVCKQIMTWYWLRYNCDTDEKKARCWNGGPAGYLKESTIPYWKEVRAILKQGE